MLRALRDAAAPATLSELTRATGLSRPTVEGVLEGLARGGLVAEEAGGGGGTQARRRAGRPARRFRFLAEAGRVVGVEIGPGRLSAVVGDLAGRPLGAAARKVAAEAGAGPRLAAVEGLVSGLVAGGRGAGALRAVGVGSPGIVGDDGVVRLCTALPGWTGLPLGERLGAAFGCPVLVENDANAAVVGERWRGAAAGAEDVV
ncbi:ROK family transcriptional regulator, partial [Streptomyces sp. DSM 44917]